MTGTWRKNTCNTATSQVNRGRTSMRRTACVPAGCEEWVKKRSFGRKGVNYTPTPHGRKFTRKPHSVAKATSAKTRRDRQRARDFKHFTRGEELCEEDREEMAWSGKTDRKLVPTQSEINKDDADLATYYEEVEDERPKEYHADACFESAAAELQSVLQGATQASVLPPPEYSVWPADETPPVPFTTVSEVMYCVRVTGEGDDMKVTAEPMQSCSPGIVVKFGGDFCFASNTYTYELEGDGTKCLVRKINVEFLVMPSDHFMDHPEHINDDDVWVQKAIAYIEWPSLPENPQSEDIVGCCEMIMHEDPDDDWPWNG